MSATDQAIAILRESGNEPSFTDKAVRFLAKDPTHLFTIRGVPFYEHPTLGDTTDIKALVLDANFTARLVGTSWFDRPDELEVDDWLAELSRKWAMATTNLPRLRPTCAQVRKQIQDANGLVVSASVELGNALIGYADLIETIRDLEDMASQLGFGHPAAALAHLANLEGVKLKERQE